MHYLYFLANCSQGVGAFVTRSKCCNDVLSWTPVGIMYSWRHGGRMFRALDLGQSSPSSNWPLICRIVVYRHYILRGYHKSDNDILISYWYFGDDRMIISRNQFYHDVHVKYQNIFIIWDYHDSCWKSGKLRYQSITIHSPWERHGKV